ncbi:DNA/RNA non-specific endonuclease [Thamnocephalis sphaerospora]|uniref:Endonuclease n=1 Tax=Thamnocephalis sphaerospora TaxID=78915 RepID=A0A4P9XLM1_9FUNG|nr:DNA/RNA non-specific endonuclease [Thamnocephalis sphaerospora]|eukprot:RKP06778.1 DNA/RNA non-specific endonuclease [Thamnocephalis sphaerospora]
MSRLLVGPISDIHYRLAYVASYNRQLRNPNWVAEHLTKEKLTKKNGTDRSHSVFQEDASLPPKFRARLADYFRSGFDRGHMAPAADAKFSQEAMNETFILTNISPQVGKGFNRNYWAYLENFCRQLTERYADVYVVSGPLYLPRQEADGKWYVHYQMIGNPPNVAVPTHFYKVILTRDAAGKEAALGAFVLPNAPIPDETPLERFAVPPEMVERAAGIELFQRVDRGRCPTLCKATSCKLTIRKFEDAVSQADGSRQKVMS